MKKNTIPAKPKKAIPKKQRNKPKKAKNKFRAAKGFPEDKKSKTNSVKAKKLSQRNTELEEDNEPTAQELWKMNTDAELVGKRLHPFITAITANAEVITGTMQTLDKRARNMLRNFIRKTPDYIKMKASLAGVISL